MQQVSELRSSTMNMYQVSSDHPQHTPTFFMSYRIHYMHEFYNIWSSNFCLFFLENEQHSYQQIVYAWQ